MKTLILILALGSLLACNEKAKKDSSTESQAQIEKQISDLRLQIEEKKKVGDYVNIMDTEIEIIKLEKKLGKEPPKYIMSCWCALDENNYDEYGLTTGETFVAQVQGFGSTESEALESVDSKCREIVSEYIAQECFGKPFF